VKETKRGEALPTVEEFRHFSRGMVVGPKCPKVSFYRLFYVGYRRISKVDTVCYA